MKSVKIGALTFMPKAIKTIALCLFFKWHTDWIDGGV
jgi:hypothetical protein